MSAARRREGETTMERAGKRAGNQSGSTALCAVALASALGVGCSSARPDEDPRARPFATPLGYPVVAGHSANDLWAYSPGGLADLQHWDGAQWSRVTVTAPGLAADVTVSAATSAGAGALWLALRGTTPRVLRVFASGAIEDHTSELGSAVQSAPVVGGTESAVILASEQDNSSYVWDGTRFVRVPAAPAGFGVVRELTFAPTDLWAASSGSDAALSHFDGVMWTRVGALPTGMSRWSALDSRHFWSAASDSRSPQSVRIVRYDDGALSVVTVLAPVGEVAAYSGFRALGAHALPDQRVAVVGLVASQNDADVKHDAVYFVYAPGQELSARRVLRLDVDADLTGDAGAFAVTNTELLPPLGDGTLVLSTTRGYVGTTYLASARDL